MDAKAIVKRTALFAMRLPLIGRVAIGYYDRRQLFPGWNREHPFDRAHGVRTSGATPAFLLGPDASPYAAAQPSIIRKALATIPDPQRCHFVDFGCGKGRALLVATEFGFRPITGVELSRPLSHIARRNSRVLARAHPDRPRIEVITGDALNYTLSAQQLVIYLYHPFGRALTARLLETIESSLHAMPRDLYIVYYNPVWADLFDASPALERRYAAQIAYDVTETGFGPDKSDGVVIWQNRGNPHPRPAGNPDAEVGIVVPDWLAAVSEPA